MKSGGVTESKTGYYLKHGSSNSPLNSLFENAIIESIEFNNVKALRQVKLPLAPFTLLLGPNGSGKSSVLESLKGIAIIVRQSMNGWQNGGAQQLNWVPTRSVTATQDNYTRKITINLRWHDHSVAADFRCDSTPQHPQVQVFGTIYIDGDANIPEKRLRPILQWLAGIEIFKLDPAAISQPVQVNSDPMNWNGSGLPAVLDNLKDNYPERWESLLLEMRRWLPEYDHILFEKPTSGQKGIGLRTKKGHHRIAAANLSQGTLVALALLTLAYLPEPPSFIALEEIDRGLHPRLLRHLQDALYRLSYPESSGDNRPPIQVIATTHSPYLLDLYRDHPEEVVLAQKEGLEVEMKRLSQIEHYEEILGDSPLSEVWYSGVLGGAAVKP